MPKVGWAGKLWNLDVDANDCFDYFDYFDFFDFFDDFDDDLDDDFDDIDDYSDVDDDDDDDDGDKDIDGDDEHHLMVDLCTCEHYVGPSLPCSAPDIKIINIISFYWPLPKQGTGINYDNSMCIKHIFFRFPPCLFKNPF